MRSKPIFGLAVHNLRNVRYLTFNRLFILSRMIDTALILRKMLSAQLESHDILRAISPRPTLVVSATDDRYSKDADEVVRRARAEAVIEFRVEGDHAMDDQRFRTIMDWLTRRAIGFL